MKQDCGRQLFAKKISIQQCQKHLSATEPGIPLSTLPRCNCCSLPINKEKIKCCFDEQSILFLGCGPVLFFRFILLSLLIIAIPSFSYSIITILENIKTQEGGVLETNKSWFFRISNIASLSKFNELNSYIMAGVILGISILIPILAIFSLKIVKKAYEKENDFFYPQYLSLLFRLDKAANYSQETVIKAINQWYEVQLKLDKNQATSQRNIIEKVYFNFNMQLYESIKKQIKQLQLQNEKEMKKAKVDQDITEEGLMKGSKGSHGSVRELMAKISRIQALKERIRSRQLQKTNKFIVVFKKLDYLLVFLNSQRKVCKKINNRILFPEQNMGYICQAPFPSQLYYNSQHIPYFLKRKKRIISWILTLFIIAAGIGLDYLVFFIYTKFLVTIISSNYGSLIISGVFYVISQLAKTLSILFVKNQYQPNQAQHNLSENRHIIATNIFLKCFSIIFIFWINEGSILADGLIDSLTWMFIIWGCLLLINQIINLQTIGRLFVQKPNKENISALNLQQAQINKYYQKPDGFLHRVYGDIISLVFSSFITSSFIPISLIICFLTLLFMVFFQRIVFVYIYKQVNPSNHFLFQHLVNLLWKFTLSLTLGHLAYIFIVEYTIGAVSFIIKILFIGLACLNLLIIFVPSSFFSPNLEDQKQLSYSDIKDKLINCYSNFNLIYQDHDEEVQTPFNFKQQQMKYRTRSVVLAEELNTISKSLQWTLRDRLFIQNQQKNPCLQAFENRQQDSMYFEYEQKVLMPQISSKKLKPAVPPFKNHRVDLVFKKSSQKREDNYKEQLKNQQKLIKLTTLVNCQEQPQIKHKIKQAIKQSINKIY